MIALSSTARICLVTASAVRAAPCATRMASHTTTAPPLPLRCGLCTVPCRRQIARSSAARVRLGVHHYGVGCAQGNADCKSHCDCHAHATVLRAAHSAWPAAVRAQLGCPHPPLDRQHARASPAPHQCAVRAVSSFRVARAHWRMYPPTFTPCSAISGEHSAAGLVSVCPTLLLCAGRCIRSPGGTPSTPATACRERALLLVGCTHACPLPPLRCVIGLSPTLLERRGCTDACFHPMPPG